MLSVAELDGRIEQVDLWVPRAAEALLSLWERGTGVLILDSLPTYEPASDAVKKTGIQALWALVDYVRWAHEKPVNDKASWSDDAAQCVNEVALRWFAELPTGGETNPADASSTNMLDDSYLLSGVALLDALNHTTTEGFAPHAVADMHTFACESVATRLITDLVKFKGAKIAPDDQPHDFFSLHVIRALDSLHDRVPQEIWNDGPGNLYTPEMLQSLAERVREDVLRQLGYQKAGMASRFDPAALVFSAVLLGRLSPADVVQLTQPALGAALASQTEDGAWPPGRMVKVASMEVALTLVAQLARDVQAGRFDFAGELLPNLDRALDLVVATHIVADRWQGWPNDRERWTGVVERWPTARVLSFTVRYADALRALRQRLVLAEYRVEETRSHTEWPDLEPTYRVSPLIDQDGLSGYSDPTEQAQLTVSLATKVLGPITRNFVGRPLTASSLILHGPPGTGKTSLVREAARALGWPLLTLSPPTFLSRGGLDGFEAAADAVFSDLQRLRRVVVLLDECEEFFLDRPDPQASDQPGSPQSRTVGAFITAGMLPRLQALHDQRWVLFVLATNVGLAALDDAVTRPGRFDYAVLIDYPVLEAQNRYVEKYGLEPARQIALLTALSGYEGDRREKGELHPDDEETPPVSFAAVRAVALQLEGGSLDDDPDAVLAELKRLADNSGPRPLYP